MKLSERFLRGAAVLAVAATIAAPAGATSLVRAGLDRLVADNGSIVVGEVLEANSYWNAEGSFMLTDVRIAPVETLKGAAQSGEFTVTLMGGRIGDLTTLIIGGAELVPGNAYLLFLNREDLPGAKQTLTVREHSQGVFSLKQTTDGLRAISQASRQPLVPDASGSMEAPGGKYGMPFTNMVRAIREISQRTKGN